MTANHKKLAIISEIVENPESIIWNTHSANAELKIIFFKITQNLIWWDWENLTPGTFRIYDRLQRLAEGSGKTEGRELNNFLFRLEIIVQINSNRKRRLKYKRSQVKFQPGTKKLGLKSNGKILRVKSNEGIFCLFTEV